MRSEMPGEALIDTHLDACQMVRTRPPLDQTRKPPLKNRFSSMLKLRPVSTLMPRWLTPVRILGAFIVLALLLEFLIPNAGLSASVAHLGGFIGSVALFVCSLTLWSKARVQIGRRKLRYKTARINAGIVAAIGLSFIVVEQTSLKLRNHPELVRPVAAKRPAAIR
jgi:hypothetical protein